MSEPFLAEIRIFGFNFAPRGWALCDGQILPINQNQSLYSLLGTMYGGDGRTSFALPDLRGRVPIHVGNGHTQGQKSGQETVTLTEQQIPQHSHPVKCSTRVADKRSPAGANRTVGVEATGATAPYATGVSGGDLAQMNPGTLPNAGNSQSHSNMQPYLVVNFAIAIQGLFPPRN